MIINMNDIYKIQYKCKKNYMRKYSTKSGSSIVYESSGGATSFKYSWQAWTKKENPSNTGIMNIVIRRREEG